MQVRRVRPRKVATGFRACSAGSSPAQRISPDRSLADTICRRIRCRHSLHRSQTEKMRDFIAVRLPDSNGRYWRFATSADIT